MGGNKAPVPKSSDTKIQAADIFSAAKVCVKTGEHALPGDVIDAKLESLRADLSVLNEIENNPLLVVEQDSWVFGSVFRGALAHKILEKELGIEKLTSAQAVTLLEKGDGQVRALCAASDSKLNDYFMLSAGAQLLEKLHGGKFEGAFRMAQATAPLLKQDGGEQVLQAAFSLLSNNTISFDPNRVQGSWEALQKVLRAPEHVIASPPLEEIVTEFPELRPLELIGMQKNGYYIGVSSALIQPVLMAAYDHTPKEAVEQIANSIGLPVQNDSEDKSIETALEELQSGRVTADQLTRAAVALGQRLLVLGLDETSVDTVMNVMEQASYLNFGCTVAATVDHGTLEVAARLRDAVGKPIKTVPKEEMVEYIIKAINVAPDYILGERKRLLTYTERELLGMQFLAIERAQLKQEDRQKVLIELMRLFGNQIQLDENTARALGEVVQIAFGKTSEDIMAPVPSVAVKDDTRQAHFVLNHFVEQIPAEVIIAHDNIAVSIAGKLQVLGRFEFARNMLPKEFLMTKAELESSIGQARKGDVVVGVFPVIRKDAEAVLEIAKKSRLIQLCENFVRDPGKLEVFDLIWHMTLVEEALTKQIIEFVQPSADVVVNISGSRLSTAKVAEAIADASATANGLLARLAKDGFTNEELEVIYKNILAKLYAEYPDHFINPDELGVNWRSKACELRVVVDARIQAIGIRPAGSGQRPFPSQTIRYRVFENPEELERFALIYQRLFEVRNIEEKTQVDVFMLRLAQELDLNPRDEQLRNDVLLAVTNYAFFTRRESSMIQKNLEASTAAASLIAPTAYQIILEIREAALQNALRRQFEAHVPSHEDEGKVFFAKTVQRGKERIAACQGNTLFAHRYRQTLLALPAITTILERGGTMEVGNGDSDRIRNIGLHLFPDFNEKQRRVLALAAVERWGAEARELLQAREAQLHATLERFQRLATLSNEIVNRLEMLLGYDFCGIGAIPAFQVYFQNPVGRKEPVIVTVDENTDQRVQVVPPHRFDSAHLEMDVLSEAQNASISPREPILSVAKNMLGQSKQVTATDELRMTILPGLREKVTGELQLVEKVAELCEQIKIATAEKPRDEIAVLELLVGQMTSDEITAARSIEEVLVNGANRANQPKIDALHRLQGQFPILHSVKSGGNLDFIVALASIMRPLTNGDDSATLKLLDPDESVFSIVTGREPSEVPSLDDIEAFLNETIEKLTLLNVSAIVMPEIPKGQFVEADEEERKDRKIPKVKRKPKHRKTEDESDFD